MLHGNVNRERRAYGFDMLQVEPKSDVSVKE